ncbi:MAG: hypothetical protein AABX13_05675 [Nanoarchaeota archaeon]
MTTSQSYHQLDLPFYPLKDPALRHQQKVLYSGDPSLIARD